MLLRNFPSDKDVVRRHSLSLLDRTPPPKSLAADILGTSFSLGAAKSFLTQIADIQDSLSEFNSCNESFHESSNESSDDNEAELEIDTRIPQTTK